MQVSCWDLLGLNRLHSNFQCLAVMQLRHAARHCALLPLQSSLNKNGLSTTGVSVASSEAAVKQAGNTCQNGAINGICIGELDAFAFACLLPGTS